jgi:Bacteriophage HK97-gp10, putative tail-component
VAGTDVTVGVENTVHALSEMAKQADRAVLSATRKVANEATRTMKKQIVGGHKLGTPRSEGRNVVAGKPSNVTGNLRRSIRSTTKGFNGRYTMVVGAYMVYARALEFGNPRWKSGVKYPFVAPTAKILSENNRARNIYTDELRRMLFR